MSSSPSSAGTVKRVLVIDDDEAVRELLRDYLKSWAPDTVDVAVNGVDAWKMLQKSPYDLTILDWRLPGVNGMTLFNRLRTLPAYDKSPVLVSSGLLVKDDFRLLDEYPCTQCLAKPYSEKVFRDSVTRLLADCQWYATNRVAINGLMQGVADKDRNALGELQRLLISHPSNTVPLTLMAARSARTRDDHKTAEALLLAALKKHPESVPAQFELAKVYFATKRYDQAMDLLAKAQKFSPKNLSRAHFMGEVALNQAQPAAAAQFFEEALKIDPEHAAAKRGLSMSTMMKRSETEATDASRVQVHQSFASMINMMAIGLVRAGKFDEGISRYQEAMEFVQDPLDRARLSYNLGLGFNRSGRPDEAKRWFQEADKLSGGTLAKAKRALDSSAGEEPLIELEDIEPETLVPAPAAAAAKGKSKAGAPPAEVLRAVPSSKTADLPTLTAGPKSPSVESLYVPEGVLASNQTSALVKKAVEGQTKAEAELGASSTTVGQVTVLLYHHMDNGWVRAEKQLQLLEAKGVKGFGQLQPLLDAVRVTPRPLVLIWNDGSEQNLALELLEALLETDVPSRVGMLVHCVGEKAVQDAKLKRPYALLYDRMTIVNWTRSKFEEDVAVTAQAMLTPNNVLSQIIELNRQALIVQKGERLTDAWHASWTDAAKKLPFPAAQLWLDALKVKCLLRAGSVAEARVASSEMLKRHPDVFIARFYQAALDAQEGMPTTALELAQWLHQAHRASAERIGLIGAMLVDYGQNDAARVVLQVAGLTGFTADYRYLMLAGRILLSESQADAAARCCEEAIRNYPRRWDLLYTYASALLQLNDIAHAILIIDCALQCLGCDQQKLLLLKGRCLGSARKWVEADACVQQVLLQSPKNAEALALKSALARRSIA